MRSHPPIAYLTVTALFLLLAMAALLPGQKGGYYDEPRGILADSTARSYRLVIPSLKIEAPIVLNVSGTDEEVYLKSLEEGVAHYAGTALPGRRGNSFIFGHSSYYKNKAGRYKEVFLHLNKLAVDSEIDVYEGDSHWRYRVFRSQIIEANDLSVLESSDEAILTLMTCWPPRTIEKRYIVQARRIEAGAPTK